jgi:hypothetical protein
MNRTIRAAVAALIVALAIAPVASAASIDESLTVNSTLTVTGVPATINYGAIDPGAASSTQSFTASVVTNSSWQFIMSGSDFTGPTGLPESVRIGRMTSATGATSATTPASFSAFGVEVFGTEQFSGTQVNAAGSPGTSGFQVDLYVDLVDHASAPAGAYSGTITYTFSAI